VGCEQQTLITRMTSNLSIAEAVISSCSMVACCTILCTFYVFPDLLKKSYISSVFFIAFSDLIASVGLSLGQLGRYNEQACWAQGILINYFSLASAMWTIVICRMMFSIKVKGKLITCSRYCHLMSWGVPAISTFLPLINSTFEFTLNSSCQIQTHVDRKLGWLAVFFHWLSYYGVIWLAITINMILLLMIYERTRQDAKEAAIENFKSTKALYVALKKLIWYPAIMMVIYGETCFADLALMQDKHIGPRSRDILQIISAIFPCFLGLLNSIAFWVSNPDIRHHLELYLFSIEQQVIAVPEHFFHVGKENAMTSIENMAHSLARVKPFATDFAMNSINFVERETQRASSLSSIALSIHLTSKHKRVSGRSDRVVPGSKYEVSDHDEERSGQHTISENIPNLRLNSTVDSVSISHKKGDDKSISIQMDVETGRLYPHFEATSDKGELSPEELSPGDAHPSRKLSISGFLQNKLMLPSSSNLMRSSNNPLSVSQKQQLRRADDGGDLNERSTVAPLMPSSSTTEVTVCASADLLASCDGVEELDGAMSSGKASTKVSSGKISDKDTYGSFRGSLGGVGVGVGGVSSSSKSNGSDSSRQAGDSSKGLGVVIASRTNSNLVVQDASSGSSRRLSEV
jgi:hypothetical protein